MCDRKKAVGLQCDFKYTDPFWGAIASTIINLHKLKFFQTGGSVLGLLVLLEFINLWRSSDPH